MKETNLAYVVVMYDIELREYSPSIYCGQVCVMYDMYACMYDSKIWEDQPSKVPME